MAGTLLTTAEIDDLLADHPDWRRDGDGLVRSLEFADFPAAFGFMTKVAIVSEKLFHHPEWSNVYNRVELRITDHDAGGISTNDRDWIARVDQLV
ncbi:MAG: 4a-hydroxytetrahydrobiopterin dehydratase [Acidimicrobiales bacterium]|nr:4a-hydroxytetrahydrobiopterin dehydratase [Acidimicrobiales bacterium]